jgi:hypothetical protein
MDSTTTQDADQQPTTQAQAQAWKRGPDFYKRWLRKQIKVKTITNLVIDGTLRGYGPYDLAIEIAAGEEIILPKHAILFVTGPREEAA